MARSACAAFGGCCSARTSWFPCVLLCVLLGLVSLPCVGRPCAQLFCCLRSSQFRALSFSAGLLTASGLRRCGGSMSLPASHCGCWVVPLAPAPDLIRKISRLCTGRFTHVTHCWWNEPFCVFGTGFHRPSARLHTAKNVLSYPSRHILSQHPHSRPSKWVPRGHLGRQNRQHSKNG